MIDRLTLSEKGIEVDGPRPRTGRRAARPGRRDGRPQTPPSGHHPSADARAAGRHQHHRPPQRPTPPPRQCLKSNAPPSTARRQRKPSMPYQAIADSRSGSPPPCQMSIQVVETADRAAVGDDPRTRVRGHHRPRGGKGLIRHISRDARVPVIKAHLDGCRGVCGQTRRPGQALAIVERQDPALRHLQHHQMLLVGATIAKPSCPPSAACWPAKGVELRACPASLAILRQAGIPKPGSRPPSDPTGRGIPRPDHRHQGRRQASTEAVSTSLSRPSTESISSPRFTRAMRFPARVDSASVMMARDPLITGLRNTVPAPGSASPPTDPRPRPGHSRASPTRNGSRLRQRRRCAPQPSPPGTTPFLPEVFRLKIRPPVRNQVGNSMNETLLHQTGEQPCSHSSPAHSPAK